MFLLIITLPREICLMDTPVNFLDSKLLPKVRSSASSMDDYEVTNLISRNYLLRSRGFIAYTTVKPPVDIDFTTICDINLHYIIVGTVLGTQKSTGIEILLKNDLQFVSVGHSYVHENGVVFCNKRYFNRKLPPNIPQSFAVAYFKKEIFCADTIRLKIYRTEKSVPSLSKVEIWGTVSKRCSQITLETIQHMLNDKTTHLLPNTISENLDNLQDDFNIPQEFLDALTYEIMSIPITLPSGNTIDNSTLEKYVSIEASQGRQPSDPFTSQKFSSNRKPVFNSSLKSRIDMFLLENSHKKATFKLKRTAGNILKRKITLPEPEKKINKEYKLLENDQLIKHKKICLNDDHIDELVSKTLTSKNFLRFTTETCESSELKEIKCCICTEKQNLYKIDCKHLYCKLCMLSIYKNLTCKICCNKFSKREIIKLNFI